MVRNYLKTSIRIILRNKVFSIINVLGLAIGLACFILIFLWVSDEIGYDRFHENAGRLYRLLQKDHIDPDFIWTTTPTPLGPLLKENIPEIEAYTRYWSGGSSVRYEDKFFWEGGIRLVDPYFLKMFTFPFIKGDLQSALPNTNALVLTESTAKKYFGSEDPVGKMLNIRDTLDLTVTAVIEDPPKKSHFQFTMLLHINLVPEYRLASWASDYPTYIMLMKEARKDSVIRKIETVWRSIDPEGTDYSDLQQVTNIHLNEFVGPSKGLLVYTFSVIAGLVLIIACINFMNLSTARSAKRSQEVGLRKVVGAKRSQLITQFLSESVLFTFLALIVAWILVELFRPAFNQITGKEIEIAYSDPVLLLTLLAAFLFTSFLSGSYPAFVLSSFRSSHVLKGGTLTQSGSNIMRNILVVFQFFISTVLIICIIMIYKQLWFIQNKDLGLNKENILVMPFSDEFVSRYDAIKEEFLRNPKIKYVSGMSNLPTHVNSRVGINWEGNPDDQGIGIDYFMADYDMIEAMEMKMLFGRSFSADFTGDDSIGYIINKTALDRMGIEDPVGHPVEFQHPYFPERFSKGKIIGVVEDFHHHPLREQITPLAIRIYRPWYNYLVLKISPDNMQETIVYVQGIARKFAPDFKIPYSFFDDEINAHYAPENKVKDIVIYFAFLSILISCLGIFGLASYTAERFTKQIGIRKVNGASSGSIVFQLIREFTKWIALGLMLGCPVAWFIMKKVLMNYAYRTDFSWWIFAVTVFIVAVMGMIAVTHQALKAARRNPADSLRYE